MLRFSGALSDAAVADYCRHIEWRRGSVIGCFVNGVLRGAAELQVDDSHFPKRGEMAIAVESPWQNQGIGSELFQHALVVARNRLVRTLYMSCPADNRRMQHVARKFTADLRFGEGEVKADIVMSSPTYLSLWNEAASDGLGLIGAWFETSLPFNARTAVAIPCFTVTTGCRDCGSARARRGRFARPARSPR